MEKPPKYLSEFGPFHLDAANRLLMRDGEIVPLKPKVFDTLLALVEQPGQVLTKTELMNRIWPDTAVEENNLNQNISVLRKILGKDSSGQDYITTIPRRGYCFTSSVHEVWEESTDLIVQKSSRSRIIVEEEQEPSDQEAKDTDISIRTELSSPTSVAKVRRLHWTLSRTLTAIAAFVALMVIIGMGWILSSQRNNEPDSDLRASLWFVPIADWKEAPRETELRNGAFSPDGKMIAFSSNRAEHSGIWIKQINGGQPIEVIGDDWHNESPIWSPDGQEIAFVSDRGDHPGIWSIPSFGGTPTLRITLQNGWPQLTLWSRKAATIYYELECNLFALDLASRQTSQVTNLDATKLSPPGFSICPEEDHIAYADGNNGRQDIWVRPLKGGEPIQVTDDPADDRYPIWHTDGKTLIYSSNRKGIYQICMANVDVRRPTELTFGFNDNVVSDISPDGSKILFVESREEGDLYKVDVDTGQEVMLTSDFGLELWPDISADGKTLAFQAANARVKMFSSSIVSRPVESSGQPLQLATDGFDPRWSPDGGKLAFLGLSNNLCNIWTVKATGGEQRQLTTDGIIITGVSGLPYNRKQARDYSWSPDGSKIAYCSMKSGQINVWAIAVDNSSETMISNNTDPRLIAVSPVWSPDGKRIAYLNIVGAHPADGGNIETILVTEPGKSDIIFHSDTALRLLGWSESGSDLIAAVVKDPSKQNSTTTQVDLYQISASGGGYQKLPGLTSAYFTNIQLSPDGRSIAYVSRLEGRDDIWVVPVLGGQKRKITNNSDPRLYFSSIVWSPDGGAIYCSKQASRSLITMIDNFRRKDLALWQKPPNQPVK
jgi:Tol biopolymer transport system component/DNA-binding winged helix-turn-helix (wHTH) protein